MIFLLSLTFCFYLYMIQMWNKCTTFERGTRIALFGMTVNGKKPLRDKRGILCHMNKKQEINAFVKECITTALLQMLETKSLDEISVTDLIKRAGVARNSFYRNFDSKKDVLEKYLLKLIEEWGKEFEALGDESRFAEMLLKHYYNYKEIYLLLYRRGLSDMIYETLRTACKLDEAQNNMERYAKSMIAGMLFGWVDEWMRQGMPETPEEIVLLTAQMKEDEDRDNEL